MSPAPPHSTPPVRALPDHLAAVARRAPERVAAVVPGRGRAWRTLSYGDLERRSTDVARGLAARGLGPGDRVALLVPPTLDFFVLAFGLLKSGVLPVLVDPGIGLANVGGCLREAAPRAFVGVPRAVAAARALGWCPTAESYVAVGARLPGGPSLADVEAAGTRLDAPLPPLDPDDDAAVAFTSGSTGPPKGVVHAHRSFLAQLELVRELNEVADGEVMLVTFPPFALFGPALGATTVVPRMDPTRPGSVDPRAVVQAANDFGATVMFGSPALLETVARGATRRGSRMPTLRRVVSAGAPVPRETQRRVLALIGPDAEVLTPYGATEALPVTSVSSRELLDLPGPGICVGRPVRGVDVALVPVDDGPLTRVEREVPDGEVGEVVARGLNVSARYWNRPDADGLAKTDWDGRTAHRMGDLAWRDDDGRLWFAGRKGHRVVTGAGRTLFSVPVEEVFNVHPKVRRTALVGVGRRPVLCVEVEPGVRPGPALTAELLRLGARDEAASVVRDVLYHPRFPVDVRHNSKIGREALARWAAGRSA